jgi:hypothetical protein
MATVLTRPLEDIREQLDAASARAREVVEGRSVSLLGRRPDEGSWSVAECLAHLSLTTDAYVPVIREALEEGRRRNLQQSGDSFRMEVSARILAWWLEPPYRLKSRTPAGFVPRMQDPADALPDFLERQRQLATLLAEANGLALDRLSIVSPFAKQMRYNVYAAFRVIAAHERRHLWQAEQTARRFAASES